MRFLKRTIRSSVLTIILLSSLLSPIVSFASNSEQESLILETYSYAKNIEFVYNDDGISYARIYPNIDSNQYFIIYLSTNTKLIWIKDAYPNAFDYKFVNGDRPYVRVYPTQGSIDYFIVYCEILDNGHSMVNEPNNN